MATKDEHRSRIDKLVRLDLTAVNPVNQTCGILLDELASALARIDELEERFCNHDHEERSR